MNTNNINYVIPDSVAVIGCGSVGTSYAYALLNQGICSSLCLIDIDRGKAGGEAADIAHGLAFSASAADIFAGDYSDISDYALLAICAGYPQNEGEDRLSLTARNDRIVSDIVRKAGDAGFRGIYLVATNPVDIMTFRTLELSGRMNSAPQSVIGTGTTLDSARLCYMLGEYFDVSPKSVNAFVMGEHGDSSFIPWTQAYIGTKKIMDIVDDSYGHYTYDDLVVIEEKVKAAADEIIAAKNVTCFGVGMAMARITRAIFRDEHTVLTVSSLMEGEYGQRNVCVGSPCIIGRGGAEEKLRINLNSYELEQFDASCALLRGHTVLK